MNDEILIIVSAGKVTYNSVEIFTKQCRIS